jgi:hypothetical protein
MAREFTSMLGIDIVVMGSSPATEAAIAEALEKKVIKEIVREPVWGRDEGYCAWCVNGRASKPIWEEGIDSQGEHVKYACCKKCAADRGVEGAK